MNIACDMRYRLSKFCFLFLCLGLSQHISAQESRTLIPKQKESKEERSTYESLTENRGSFAPEQKAPEQKQETPTVSPQAKETAQGPIINFNNVNITEILKYVSRLTGKNFIYDPLELQFNITMISDSPSSIDEIMAMVLQSLRAHGYLVIEEGGVFVIHTNPTVRTTGALENKKLGIDGPQLATQVFVLQNTSSDQIAAVVKAMVSEGAIVEAVGDAKLIVSDITENLKRITNIIKQLDTTSGGLEIGQYVAVNVSPPTLVSLAERVITPLAGDKPLVLVPHAASNSVFIVSTPFLIQRVLSIMQTVDLNMAKTGIISQDFEYDFDAAEEARKRREEEEQERKEVDQRRKDQELDILSDEEIRARLIQEGIDPEYVNSMSLQSARDALRNTRRKYGAESDLPVGTVESTEFLIHRLQYRKSTEVAKALRSIADSISGGGGEDAPSGITVNPELAHSDLLITLYSLQPVDDNNTIVFTGTAASLRKVKQLISQIDLPVRQVFIEALVLNTTLTNSLQFGVEWGGKIQRTNLGAAVNFRRPDSEFGAAFDAVQQVTPVQVAPPPAPAGISIGNLGRKIKFLGRGFRSTGALIQALRSDDETHIMLNPQIVTEHNVPAEIFVGAQVPIKGQSVANTAVGGGAVTNNLVTTNYETQETGVLLKVTPLISSHETVTLIIEQQNRFTNSEQINAQAAQDAPPATVREIRTTTRVHMPSDHFLMMSGMIQEDTRLQGSKIPCLGGFPVIGGLFGTNRKSYGKQNVIIFIRPIIIDTEQDIDELTRHREAVFKEKCRVQSGFNKEMDDAKMLLNLNPPLY